MDSIDSDTLPAIARVLSQSYAPSGDESQRETVENQVANEQELEELFHKLENALGLRDEVTIRVFLKLFDVWIGLYRLDKCDEVFGRLGDNFPHKFNFQLIQTKAFLRWKQGALSEALRLFQRLEGMLEVPSMALCENIAHTYSSLGDLEMARSYFEKCLSLCDDEESRGGVYLGLGILKERLGKTQEGLGDAFHALDTFEKKFSRRGNESSLEAKCCAAISRMYWSLGDLTNTVHYATRAIRVFERTCGDDSPLIGPVLVTLAEASLSISDWSNAKQMFVRALGIEAGKDALDLVGLMHLFHSLRLCMKELDDPPSEYMPILNEALAAVSNARERVRRNGNLGAFIKAVAEIAIYAKAFPAARELLTEAAFLFEAERDVDCSKLAEQSNHLVQLLDSLICGT